MRSLTLQIDRVNGLAIAVGDGAQRRRRAVNRIEGAAVVDCRWDP